MKTICLMVIALSLISIAVSIGFYGYHITAAIKDKGVTFLAHVRVNVAPGGSYDVAAHNSTIIIMEAAK